jgi:hypothetical protein
MHRTRDRKFDVSVRHTSRPHNPRLAPTLLPTFNMVTIFNTYLNAHHDHSMDTVVGLAVAKVEELAGFAVGFVPKSSFNTYCTSSDNINIK